MASLRVYELRTDPEEVFDAIRVLEKAKTLRCNWGSVSRHKDSTGIYESQGMLRQVCFNLCERPVAHLEMPPALPRGNPEEQNGRIRLRPLLDGRLAARLHHRHQKDRDRRVAGRFAALFQAKHSFRSQSLGIWLDWLEEFLTTGAFFSLQHEMFVHFRAT